MRLHHVQVACPPGGEHAARAFLVDGLGLSEVEKPEALRARGGLWARHPGGAEIHVGVEEGFVPARKAHPALLLDSVADLERAGRRLEAAGYVVDGTQATSYPGHHRLHVLDGHGNRWELLA